MDTMNKGSQPQMILFHYTTVQKVMLVGLKCGAINLHTCMMSSLRRSVHCVKVLGVNCVPNSLAISPGPNTEDHTSVPTLAGASTTSTTVYSNIEHCTQEDLYISLQHTLWCLVTVYKCIVFMVGSLVEDFTHDHFMVWSSQFFGEMLCSTKQSRLSYSSQ